MNTNILIMIPIYTKKSIVVITHSNNYHLSASSHTIGKLSYTVLEDDIRYEKRSSK